MSDQATILDHNTHPHVARVRSSIIEMMEVMGQLLLKSQQLRISSIFGNMRASPTDPDHVMEILQLALGHTRESKMVVVLPIALHSSTRHTDEGVYRLKKDAMTISQFLESEAFKNFVEFNADSHFASQDGHITMPIGPALELMKTHLLKLQDICMAIPCEVTYHRSYGMKNLILPFRLNLTDELMDDEPTMSFQVEIQLHSPANLAMIMNENNNNGNSLQ